MYDLCKFHKYNSSTNNVHLFDQSYRQLVIQHTIFQNSLNQFLKNLLLINILQVIHFLFARKLKIRIPCFLWLYLTFIDSSLTSLWTKQNFCVKRAFQKKRKVKRLLERHFKQVLTLQLNVFVLYLMMLITNKLKL